MARSPIPIEPAAPEPAEPQPQRSQRTSAGVARPFDPPVPEWRDEPKLKEPPRGSFPKPKPNRPTPAMLARINDDTISDSELTPVEIAARQWRNNVIADLGGPDALATTKLSLIGTALGTFLILSALDSYVIELASTKGLVSRKYRKGFGIIEQRARVADSFVRQLEAIGLDRKVSAPASLNEIIEQAKRAHGSARDASGRFQPSGTGTATT